jgi:lysophospholipase L1-like esterase
VFYSVASILIIILIIGVLLVALARQRRWARARQVAAGLLVSYGMIVLLLAGGEAYFRFFHADSEGRLASNNWIARYWRENSLGYRDREWQPSEWAGKTTIAMVGDSFTAGWGIEDPADRASDVLAARLGNSYAVFNLGLPGTSTPEQLGALQAFPTQPDVVILQYFLNDIQYALLSLGLNAPSEDIPPLARESYLANYLYARTTAGFGGSYWQQMYAHYDNFAIWDVHRAELEAFADYVEGIDARLIVVIYPNLQDPVASIPYVDRVAQVFTARDVEVVKLFDTVAAMPTGTAYVSPRDAHPSVALHEIVGEMLAGYFEN